MSMLKGRSAGPGSLTLLGALLLLYLVSPLVYFLFKLPWQNVPGQLLDPEALSALLTSLLSATLALSIT